MLLQEIFCGRNYVGKGKKGWGRLLTWSSREPIRRHQELLQQYLSTTVASKQEIIGRLDPLLMVKCDVRESAQMRRLGWLNGQWDGTKARADMVELGPSSISAANTGLEHVQPWSSLLQSVPGSLAAFGVGLESGYVPRLARAGRCRSMWQ